MTSAVSISTDRSGMPGSLAPLVLNGSVDGSYRRLTAYSPPALQSRVTWMPDSDFVEGSEAIGAVWQQSMLGFSVQIEAATETLVQAAYAEMVAAWSQFSFTVTTQLSGAPAQVWAANRGSIQLADSTGRTFADVHNLNPVYAVTIPVYPIAS